MEQFKPTEIEKKWQARWLKSRIYEPDLLCAKKPFYNLMMFPYPSAEGLHVGNMYAFTGSDIYGRFKKMNGFDVFEPIGLDGFGIHSENYALKIGEHPKEVVGRTEANFYRQLHATGNAYSWSNKLETYKSNYYKWTQWIFIQLFKAGLAYRAKSAVNWCPHCLTVLADEQVVDAGVCERCGTQVENKELEQWFFRITKYAQKLLDGLEKIDWSEKVKIAQRNWLGKSEGVEILFPCDIEKDTLISVFTTRADTIFGVTYLALAPEHPLVTTIVARSNKLLRQEITRYVSDSLKKSEEERIGQVKQPVKTGIDTGFCATNPINGKKVPIFVADYVLSAYGTGAVMGVPAHDVRDLEFAKKFKLEVIGVVVPTAASNTPGVKLDAALHTPGVSKGIEWDFSQKAFTDSGVLANSGKFNGLVSEEGIQSIIKYLEMHHLGSLKSMWHLRDWIISRQRYWGPPIPMIFCEHCAGQGKGELDKSDWESDGWYSVAEDNLPVELPDIKNFKPTHSTHSVNSGQASSGQAGLGPLARHPEFYRVKCPGCGSEARRETDVSDTFLDSAWYFLRYTSIDDDRHAWMPERVAKWLPVNMYIGGAEHSVLHLLYSRFLWKVLYDLGYFDFSSKGRPASGWDEPFTKFRAHGLLISKGAKMSKSKGNVVIPDEYIEKYGSDTLRCYLMFCGRFTQGGDFRDSGIEGMYKFLRRVWRLVAEATQNNTRNNAGVVSREIPHNFAYFMHKTIKKVTEDIESLDYNTAIAALMEWLNFLEEKVADPKGIYSGPVAGSSHPTSSTMTSPKQYQDHKVSLRALDGTPSARATRISRAEIKNLLLLLAPFAPHMTEELWSRLSGNQVIRQSGKRKSDNSWSIHIHPWPKYDPKLATAQTSVLVVEVNGKVRDKINVARGVTKAKVQKLALASDRVQKYLGGKSPQKVIFVPGRLINFVI